MKMEIVDPSHMAFDGRVSKHLSAVAWDYSRPRSESKPIQELLSLDASMNEIPSVVVAITSSAIEREVITTLRDHVIWARTSRVDDVTEFRVPRFFESGKYMHELTRARMRDDKRMGEPQDEYRLLLPIVHETQYMARFSMRSLHKLHHEFEKLSEDARDNNAKMMFMEASQEMADVLSKMGLKHGNCRYQDLLPNVSNFKHNRVAAANSIVSCQMRMPFSLRSHLVRHRNLKITDNLRTLCVGEAIGRRTLKFPVEVEVSGTDDDWARVLSNRSCWMAHQGLWAPLVKNVSRELNRLIPLPCDGGTCPYETDAKARLTDADPGSPCPEYFVLTGIESSSLQRLAMAKTVIEEQRADFWRTIIWGKK